MTAGQTLQLGLIGDNIARSRSPLLHRLGGRQNDVEVRYDRLVPKDLNESFDEVFEHCAKGDFRGINVTYPYKEFVTSRLTIEDPMVRAIGAVNTVTFDKDGARGHNTDYSGFIAAYQHVRGDAPTGPVTLIGTGGVGRAVAFGLARLGAASLRLVDRDLTKAEALAAALKTVASEMDIEIFANAEDAAKGAAGLINCTPVGMVGYEGTPLPRSAMTGAKWAFDAVYTPADTQFLTDAAAEGLTVISGWELFFYQGVHAWAIFAGLPLDQDALRVELLKDEDAE